MAEIHRFNSDTIGNPKNFAGNNYFRLSTGDGKNTIDLIGICTDMPSFGMSTSWTEAPINTFGKKVQEFFMNDLMQAAGYVLNANNKNQVLVDDWSSRMYDGSKTDSIQLQFRIYSQNTLNQTPVTTWIKALSKYASIKSDNVLSMNELVQNIKNTVEAAKNSGETAGQFLNMIFGKDEEQEEDEGTKTIKKKKRKNMISMVPPAIEQAVKEVRNTYAQDKTNQDLLEVELNYGSKRKVKQWSTMDIINMCTIDMSWWSKNITRGSETEDIDYTDKTLFKFVFKWPTIDAVSYMGGNYKIDFSDEKVDANTITDDGDIDVDSVINGLQSEDSDWKNKKVLCQDKVLEYFIAVLIKANNILKDFDTGTSDQEVEAAKIDNKDLSELVKKLENEVASEFNTEDRPYKVNFLAANLWALHIYPFIFKKPIIVTITNWTVTPSLEMQHGTHAYYDFSITCQPDQVRSLTRWKQCLEDVDPEKL